MGHWANFQGAGEQIERADTDGKQGHWDLVVNLVCAFPVSICNILTYYEENMLSTHMQSCLEQTLLTFDCLDEAILCHEQACWIHTQQDGT